MDKKALMFTARIAEQVLYRDMDGKLTSNLFLQGRTSVKDLAFRGNVLTQSLCVFDGGRETMLIWAFGPSYLNRHKNNFYFFILE